jgi:hypothetical protein
MKRRGFLAEGGGQYGLLRAPGPFAPGVENGVFQAIHQAMKKVGR